MSVSSSTSSGSPPIVASGLVSGLNTAGIIQAELQSYQQPITNLQNQQTTLNNNVGDYQQINSDLASLQAAADKLSTPSGWNARSATVSDPTVATATASSGTPVGNIQFNVLNLASADSLVSSGSVSSTSQIVASSPDFLLSQGGGTLGFSSLSSGSGLTLGSHTVAVTQASAGASATGTAALQAQPSGISISGTNDTLNVTVGTQSYSLVIGASPSGGYSGSSLLSAVQSAITAGGAGGVLQAGYDSSGHLQLSTTAQGSSQTLSVTGGTALTTLGLATTGTLTGTDAVITVDGVANTITNVSAGSTLTLNGKSGATISATVAPPPTAGGSLLSVGSLTATDVSTGNGSLADLVSNINSAGTGITASAVQTSTSTYVLQLTSSTTGAAANLSLDNSAFSGSALGAMKTASAGQDAQIQVGGAGGYTVSSGTDTFTGLLPGLSVTVQKQTTNPVSISVGSDSGAIASSVQSMVDDANTVLSDLQKYAGYNAATKTGGPLMGSAPLQNLTNTILATFASATGTSTLGNSVSAGITISNGTISFDKTAFETAYSSNPSQVQAMFTAGGSLSPSAPSYTGMVAFNYASNTTKAGSYAVNVSQSATQAVMAGATLTGGTVTSGETLTVAGAGTTVSYSTTSGQTLASIAQGLNAAFASQSLGLSAQVLNGNQLELRSTDYGSSSSFTVSTTNSGSGTLGLTAGSASATATGTDVQGTINGVAAVGTGQYLSAPLSDPTLGGLTLQVTATGITSPTSLGNFTYAPGLAQELSNVSNAASDPVQGTITQTIKELQNQSTNLNPQIQFYTQMMDTEKKLLTNTYAKLEATLGTLKNQSSMLASAIAKLG